MVLGEEHPWNIWRKEQNTSQFEGVSLLFQGKEKDVNKRESGERRGNQESVAMGTKVAKETFKKLEQQASCVPQNLHQ